MAFSMACVSSFLVVFIIACSIFGCSAAADDAHSKEFVLTLNHSNFTDFVAKHKFIVVEFYTPGCEECKELAPEYEKAASILSASDPPLVLAKVDAADEQNKALTRGYELRDYPSLKILRYGGSVVQEYKGPKKADGIVEYVKRQSGPASTEIKSSEDVGSVIDSYKIFVVGVFPDFSGEKFENFTTVAERLRADYEFGHTSDAQLLPHGDSSASGPLVRLFKPFDELFVEFEEFDVDALVKFVEESSIPTVTVFDKDPKYQFFLTKVFMSPNAKAIMFVDFSTDPFDAFKSKYHEVAQLYMGKNISFVLGNPEAEENMFQYYGLKQDQVPFILIVTNDQQNYLKPNVEPDQIASWIKDFKDGIVPPYLKSEPVPEVNNEPVKVVVTDSLQDMVFNSGKNVLLEFYAPWCKYCVELAPTLDEVAVAFENDADVLIAKFDATANDPPREIFDVKGYPTLYFRSSTGNLLKYEGERTKEDFIDFINKNRSAGAKLDSRKDEL